MKNAFFTAMIAGLVMSSAAFAQESTAPKTTEAAPTSKMAAKTDAAPAAHTADATQGKKMKGMKKSKKTTTTTETKSN